MERPIYSEAHEVQLGDHGNRGLWYTRFFDRYAADWTLDDDAKRTWISNNAKLVGLRQQLESHALRHFAVIKAAGGEARVFTTDWHFATGLGLPHPVENGLAWHPTLGVPYLAGSGVKGLLRAWIDSWDESPDAVRQQRLETWFGTGGDEGSAGRFVFFDALPIEPVQLAADVMTPHMGKWYEQGDAISEKLEPELVPADWHDPVPVPFLVVKQAKFLFGIAPRRPEFATDLPLVHEALESALSWLGAGAKTAAGYGRMLPDTSAQAALQELLNKQLVSTLPIERQRIEQLRAEFSQAQQRNDKTPGGMLGTLFREIATEATDWGTAERAELVELLTQINKFMEGNQKKRRVLIDALRN
ncbi:MAG: type III-B CRISPR module RAMP protein Cmr6 [Candidatus Competibacteraceae bacterium]|nr:type III-B CRISPR module RAMP protein Cmr6 [Candidatus Competibacteraceae bacterium]MCB1803812.1 type III-B CRISPR module RAMP protein Cmr6 [Candidatus Competibacteraceae bacterium]MCB1813245.1 type III-B CRISPR module RAMP protein Cmr6 [Candidatus Competibacteraceae bacterium]